MLEVNNVDWHLLENAKAHHTDRYEVVHEESTPVIRRAQPFKLTINFKNRDFNEAKDNVRLFFLYGSDKLTPRLQTATDNTTVTSYNKIDDSEKQWSLQLIKQGNKSVTLLVRGPSKAIWGTWNLNIKSKLKTSPKAVMWKDENEFYLIYNPWCKDDEAYMPDTRYLDEFILNDIGKLYTSSAAKPIGMKWIFGQFSASVIKVLKQILTRDKDFTQEDFSSPVLMCEFLTLNIAAIAQGGWSDGHSSGGNYSGGTAPWLWTGSIPIYDEYLKTKTAVKYAQTFVYSGLLTTALRAVGIASRSVTNFISCISGYNMAANNVYDKNGNLVDSDTIWNFHVWNEAWMSRNDLPPGYGGWQVADGSTSDGPIPVSAVKNGDTKIDYGVKLIVMRTNADRVRWTRDENNEYHLVSIDTKYIGRCVLTKQPFIYDPHGDTDFEDITQNYKNPEGSKEERMALYNAIKEGKVIEAYNYSFKTPFHIDMPTDKEANITFTIVECETVLFGNALNATVNIENGGNDACTVECCLGASTMYFNGSIASLIKKEIKAIKLEPKSKATFTVAMTSEEYASKLVEFTLIKIHCMATVKENNYTWANDSIVAVDMPEIIIDTKEDLEVNKKGVLQFQLTNFLKVKLTKCNIVFEAPGLGRNVTVPCKDIKPGETAVIEQNVKPTIAGDVSVKAIFTSKELNILCGTSFIQIL